MVTDENFLRCWSCFKDISFASNNLWQFTVQSTYHNCHYFAGLTMWAIWWMTWNICTAQLELKAKGSLSFSRITRSKTRPFLSTWTMCSAQERWVVWPDNGLLIPMLLLVSRFPTCLPVMRWTRSCRNWLQSWRRNSHADHLPMRISTSTTCHVSSRTCTLLFASHP